MKKDKSTGRVSLTKKEMTDAFKEADENLMDASKICGVHRSIFRREWKRHFGDNPSQIKTQDKPAWNKIKLNKGQVETALKTTKNLDKTCKILNISNATLIRFCKDTYGVPPSELLIELIGVDKEKYNYDEFMSELVSELGKTRKPFVSLPYKNRFEGKQIEDAVLMISDSHIGKKVDFPDFNDVTKMERVYDTKQFIKESNTFLRHIDAIIQQNLAKTYQIDTLWVMMLGDIFENDRIFRGNEFNIDMDIGKQVITGIEVFSDMFDELLKVFKEVKVVNIPGNHGRTTPRYDASPASRNFDWLFGKILQISFRNQERIEFNCPNSFFWKQKIRNWNYYLSHGNDVRSWMSMPFYGVTRKVTQRRVELDFNYALMGHHHKVMEIPISGSGSALINGAWIPKDGYAWEQFGQYSYPEQIFFGVSRLRPMTWRFNIDLLDEKERSNFFKNR